MTELVIFYSQEFSILKYSLKKLPKAFKNIIITIIITIYALYPSNYMELKQMEFLQKNCDLFAFIMYLTHDQSEYIIHIA